MKQRILLLATLMLLSGCSNLYPPWRSPVEYPIDYRQVSDNNVTVVTMTDERRSVIIAPGALKGPNSDLRVCPEPPADAADSFSSYFKARLAGGSTAGEKQVNGEASLTDGTSSALSAIFPRSQGIELFRDGSQALCLAWLNDIYNNEDKSAWRQDFRLLMQLAYQLIYREIDHPSKSVTITAQPSSEQQPPQNVDDNPDRASTKSNVSSEESIQTTAQ